jgi:hypothetical protein
MDSEARESQSSDAKADYTEEPKGTAETTEVIGVQSDDSSLPEYRLYKRRFIGITSLVIVNIVSGMTWPWFGPISNDGRFSRIHAFGS